MRKVYSHRCIPYVGRLARKVYVLGVTCGVTAWSVLGMVYVNWGLLPHPVSVDCKRDKVKRLTTSQNLDHSEPHKADVNVQPLRKPLNNTV